MAGHDGYVAATGTQFQLTDEFALTLHEVSDPVQQADFFCYSLVFRGAADRPIQQGTYTLAHSEIGDIDLFLVPIGPADDTLQYEAVFSHHLDQSCP
jgi:hypothetical protein